MGDDVKVPALLRAGTRVIAANLGSHVLAARLAESRGAAVLVPRDVAATHAAVVDVADAGGVRERDELVRVVDLEYRVRLGGRDHAVFRRGPYACRPGFVHGSPLRFAR